MNIKQIEKELATKNLIVVYGTESFNKEEYIDTIINNHLDQSLRDFNFSKFFADEVKLVDFFAVTQTMPMMSERRIVLLKKCDKISQLNLSKTIENLKRIPFETIVIFESDKLPKAPWSNFLKKNAVLIECKPVSDYKIVSWIIQHSRNKYNRRMAEESAIFLSSLVGNNLYVLDQELNKIDIYLKDREVIDTETIQFLTGAQKNYTIFDLINSIVANQPYKAVKILNYMVQDGSPFLLILTMLVKFVTQVSLIQSLSQQGISDNEIIKKIRIHQFVYNKYRPLARKYTHKHLCQLYMELLKTDLSLKSRSINDRINFEKLLLKFFY